MSEPLPFTDTLEDFTPRDLILNDAQKRVYVSGTGPAVIVMAEMPGMTPHVIRFARWVRGAGFTVYMPSLFGRDGVTPSADEGADVFRKACVSAEFRAFAGNGSSPVTQWLRALAAFAHGECGGLGVGAIGMCFTGNFALAMMLEPAMLAPVLAQPALPMDDPAGVESPPEELAAIRRRLDADDLSVLAYRFEGDHFCQAQRFTAYADALGDRFDGRVLPDTAANTDVPPFTKTHVPTPHSVVTTHLIDEDGEPTQIARDEILSFFQYRLGVQPNDGRSANQQETGVKAIDPQPPTATPPNLNSQPEGFSSNVKSWFNSGSIVSLQGYDVFYQVRGQGPALVIIHGYPYSSYDFHLIAESLSKSHRVVLFDLPGMGFSQKPMDGDFSFELYSQLVNDLLGHLQIEEVDLLTHDLGVSVAQELIARGPSNSIRIRSIAFMNGGLFTDTYRPRLIQRVLSQSPDILGSFLSRRLTRRMIEKSVLSLFGSKTQPSQELLDDWWSILNYQSGKAIAYRLGRLVFDKEKYQDRWHDAMQNTEIPLAYLCGPADPNSGRHMAERYREHLPTSRIEFFSDHIGHWPQLEAPDEVLSAYEAFRDELGVAAS